MSLSWGRLSGSANCLYAGEGPLCLLHGLGHVLGRLYLNPWRPVSFACVHHVVLFRQCAQSCVCLLQCYGLTGLIFERQLHIWGNTGGIQLCGPTRAHRQHILRIFGPLCVNSFHLLTPIVYMPAVACVCWRVDCHSPALKLMILDALK